jgi:hypothetical protein
MSFGCKYYVNTYVCFSIFFLEIKDNILNYVQIKTRALTRAKD